MKRTYEFAEHDAGTNQGLLSQLVVPRPIAMVSTRRRRRHRQPLALQLLPADHRRAAARRGHVRHAIVRRADEALLRQPDGVGRLRDQRVHRDVRRAHRVDRQGVPVGHGRGRDARLHPRRGAAGVGARGGRGPRPPRVLGSIRPCRSAASRRPSCSSSPRWCAPSSTTPCSSRPTSTTPGSTSTTLAPIGRSGARTFIRTIPGRRVLPGALPVRSHTMKALLYEQPGGPDVLQYRDVADPEPGPLRRRRRRRGHRAQPPRRRAAQRVVHAARLHAAAHRRDGPRRRRSSASVTTSTGIAVGRPRRRRPVAGRRAGRVAARRDGRPVRRARRDRRAPWPAATPSAASCPSTHVYTVPDDVSLARTPPRSRRASSPPHHALFDVGRPAGSARRC